MSLTNPKLRIRGSNSCLVGDEPKTYSTILTPKPSDLGDSILLSLVAGKLPDLRPTKFNGCETV